MSCAAEATNPCYLSGLRTADLTEEAPFALFPQGHPLAQRSSVTTAELGQDAKFAAECPPIGLDEIIDRVILGRLVTVVGSGATERISPEVAAVAVWDLPTTRLVLAWPARTTRPAVTAFVEAARRLEVDRNRGVAGPARAWLPLIPAVVDGCGHWGREREKDPGMG